MLTRLFPVARQASAQVLCARPASVISSQFVRTFCAPVGEGTAPPEEKKYTGPPHLAINSHTGRYAGMIFRTAEENEIDHDDVLESLMDINEALNTDVTLKTYLEDSSTKQAEKDDVLGELYLQLEAEDEDTYVDELAEEMVDFLIENKELSLLPEVVTDYNRMVLDHNDEIEACVTTSEDMTQDQEDRVYARLSDLAGEGKVVLMDTEVDPELLGGMTVSFGDSYQDLSVRAALNAAESALRAQ